MPAEEIGEDSEAEEEDLVASLKVTAAMEMLQNCKGTSCHLVAISPATWHIRRIVSGVLAWHPDMA